MSFLRADDEEWMRELPIPKAPVIAASRCFERRSKVSRLDDLVADVDKEKQKRQQRQGRQSDSSSSDSSDEDDATAKKHREELVLRIEKCSQEMADEAAMKDAPKWGENVFGAQKEFPSCRLNPDSIKWITSAANSLDSRTSLLNGDNDTDGEKPLLDLLCGNWMMPLSFRRNLSSEILSYVFNLMAYSANRNYQRAACEFLCEYFSKQGDKLDWKPDFAEVFRCYGYEDDVQDLDAGAAEASELPPNFSHVLKCLAALLQSRSLQSSKAESYIFILARCLLDRKLLPFSLEIQDCLALLVNHFTEDEFSLHLRSISQSLARVSKELLNVVHVAKTLRGARERIQRLRSGIAFELLQAMDKEKLRQPKQAISSLQSYDLGGSVDFVKLYYHVEIVDMWLRDNRSFKADPDAFSLWISVLKGLSVRIFCGDYRTFANKVRNRAAFLISIYSELGTLDDH